MAPCSHSDIEDSRCRRCGICVHEVVLNRACYFCGELDPEVTVRPSEPPVVPADRLRRGSR